MAELLLGIDVGTSSTKGVLTRPDGRVVASAVRRHAVAAPHPGWAEHDPVAIWWEELCAVARELVQRAGQDRIAAVGVSGIGPCLVPADASGEPLRPAILYAIDTRASAEIDKLNEQLGVEAIRARCGSPLTSQSIGPKMLWLRRRESDVWRRARRWFMTNGYLAYRLTGEYVLDHSSASQAGPLYDVAARDWIPEWCETIAPSLEWPRLLMPTETAGTVTRHAAEQTHLPVGTAVVVATTDAWAEACSAGVTAPGDVMVMYGSSMALIEVLAGEPAPPIADSTVGVLPGVFAGQTNLVAHLPTGGAIVDWLAGLLSTTHDTLAAEAIAAGRGAGGLVVLPYFAGLRTPVFDPFARGAVLGLETWHTRGHVYRAALEGVACAMRHNLEAMQMLGGTGRRLIAVGGGTRGGLAVQVASDVIGQPQELPRYTIGACHGDALLAGLGVGLVADPTGWNPIESVVTPLGRDDGFYNALYECHLRMYDGLRDPLQLLASIRARL